MKYLFFVQGEGRGHMTQALALKEKLEARGHTVSAIILGTTGLSPVPAFFKEALNCPLIPVTSPSFVVDKKNQGIKVFNSTLLTIWRLPIYYQSLKKIRRVVLEQQPDALVNFYESLAGNYYRFYREKKPLFCIGHQHFINHPVFKFPKISLVAKFSFNFYNRLTAPSRAKKIALSFTKEADQAKKNLFICPPLIRRVIKNQVTSQKDFILIYLLNSGYSEEIINWNKKNPQVNLEAFWDKPGELETKITSSLIFHYLDGQKFIDRLTTCSAYATTAGFDSIAEAAYLQKNILMIPTKNHFEQKCNAIDAVRAGLAMTANHFDLSLLTSQQSKTQSQEALALFKNWVDEYDNKIVELLEKI